MLPITHALWSGFSEVANYNWQSRFKSRHASSGLNLFGN